MTGPLRLVVSCEHGGGYVPPRFTNCFQHTAAALESHRSYDAGALELARHIARRADAPLLAARVTRLLVDLNRSPGHRALFSEFTSGLNVQDKRAILQQHYFPHRCRLQAAIASAVQQGRFVVHLGVHTFAPVLRGRPRRADVGLLYDPARPAEKAFCRRWQQELAKRMPSLIVRRNYPYLGRSDGLTTALRRHFDPEDYLGLELEVNQSWTESPAADRRQLVDALAESLVQECQQS